MRLLHPEHQHLTSRGFQTYSNDSKKLAFHVVQCLAKRTDPNPNENLWVLPKKSLAIKFHLRNWKSSQVAGKIPLQHIENLIESMPNSKTSVIRVKGQVLKFGNKENKLLRMSSH